MYMYMYTYCKNPYLTESFFKNPLITVIQFSNNKMMTTSRKQLPNQCNTCMLISITLLQSIKIHVTNKMLSNTQHLLPYYSSRHQWGRLYWSLGEVEGSDPCNGKMDFSDLGCLWTLRLFLGCLFQYQHHNSVCNENIFQSLYLMLTSYYMNM